MQRSGIRECAGLRALRLHPGYDVPQARQCAESRDVLSNVARMQRSGIPDCAASRLHPGYDVPQARQCAESRDVLNHVARMQRSGIRECPDCAALRLHPGYDVPQARQCAESRDVLNHVARMQRSGIRECPGLRRFAASSGLRRSAGASMRRVARRAQQRSPDAAKRNPGMPRIAPLRGFIRATMFRRRVNAPSRATCSAT